MTGRQQYKIIKDQKTIADLNTLLNLAEGALFGLLRIAEIAMPATYFISDSRCIDARNAIAAIEAGRKMMKVK